MVTPLLLVAFLANLFMLVLSKGQPKCGRTTTQPPCETEQPPSCRINEIWSNCPIAVCAPKTCNDVGFPVACPDLRPDGRCPVPPGCICREGYVRNHRNICVPMTHCPSCGGDSNAVSGNSNNCNRLCSNYNKKYPDVCTMDCTYNCCECRLGFVFDEVTGKCVFPSQCTYLTCNVKHEVYDPCPAPCPFRTCGIDDRAISCVPPLNPGDPNCPPPKCRCRDGYYRNDEGECVLWEQCPVCSGLNEMYDPCPAPCPPQRCDVNIALILCAVPPKLGDPECQPGCRCIDNYVRNHTGVCIPRDQCPTCPNQNEVYDACIAPCPPRRCDVDDRLIRCAAPPKLGDKDCVAGCRCADGYYRNSYGICVTRAECPSCDGPNEFYACGGACDNECATLHERNQTNCPIINIRCNDKCYCIEGFARNAYNICIPIEDCPERQCTGQHEVYSDCIQGDCKPKTCTELGFPISCPRIDPAYCERGCLCKDGFVRDKNGVCIPKEKCPSCGGDCNAVSGCGVHCNNYCSDIGKEPRFCIEICYENACDCREGYYFDNNTKKCELPDQCTPTCGAYEMYSDCVQENCDPQHCNQLGFPINCSVVDRKQCEGGCLCKPGYVRNAKGFCIPVKECPSCGGDPNAESGCGKNCGRLCSNYKEKGVACTLECQINGCDCRKTHVFDSNTKKCVLPKDCTPVCKKKHEVYSECINGGCSRKNCSQVGLPVPCVKIDPKYCIKGCLCKEGYLREENGECVLEKDCKPKCNKPNEYYESCDYNCPPNTCESLIRAYACPIREGDKCKGRCKCKKGYYRNKIGECITEKQCRKCLKPHEYFSCGGACDNVCTTLHKQNQTNCPIVNIKCNEMCYCEKNYARAKNGTCIPIKHCKTEICSGDNEVYEDCTNPSCRANKCSELGFPLNCTDEPECTKGCVCKDGFVRNSNEVCIPVNKCPSCGGDPNAESGCGKNCGRLCSNYKEEGVVCTLECQINGCDCRKTHVFDSNTKKCVLPKDCTPVCKKNEVYSECINGGCSRKNCSQVGLPVPCVKIDPKYCIKGCLCKEGYLREENGECVLEKDCKPSCGGDPNAEPGCGTNCGKKCEDLGKEPVACTLECRLNACDCKDGFYYDKNKKKCVPASECTGICSGKNEVYEDCENPTCRAKKCSEVGFPLNCTYVPECNKGCVCKDGYVRNTKEVCIPIKHCPSCGGDENAQSGCGVNCLKTCHDFLNPDKPKPCPKICRVNACDCKDDFYLDENTKKCVPSSNCTPTCGKDEIFDPCTNGGCTIKNCSQIGGPMPSKTPKKCIPGCSCKEGFLRSSKGVCIPMEKCPKAKCGKNEKFIMCPSGFCGPRHCDQLGYPIKCPVIKDGCCPGSPGCICVDNYVRDEDGQCIPVRECPSCGGDPNAWAGCGVNCGKHCDDLNNKTRICPRICIENSCDCKDNYYYDDIKRQCVKPTSCTPSCPDNEIYDNCVNGGCGWRNCSQINDPMLCIDPIKCKGGCTCKKDYLRDDATGVCVPKDKCPKICDKPNEVFVKCPQNCPPQTCESINKTYHCPKVKTDESDCVGDCRCIDGFFRNLNGECISEEDCGKCPGEHQYHSCGPACDNVCCNLDTQSKDNCPIKNKKCVEKCYCQDNYARDNDDKCVPIDECPDSTPVVNSTVALANFQQGNFELTVQLLKEYCITRPGDNIMISALSIMIAFAQMTLPAFGKSLEQLLKLQHLKNKEEVRVVYPIIIKSLQDIKDVIFESKNKFYADEKNCPLTEQFIKDANEVFFAEAENINFIENVEAADKINNWISESTRGLINDLVKPEMFSALTRLAVFNVLYFLGNWQYQFDEKNTKPAKFYLNDEDSMMVPIMNQINTFQYAEIEELDAKALILPYKGRKFKLIIILPNSYTGLKNLLEKFDADALENIKESMSPTKCNVSVPLMDFANDYSDLKETLIKIGLSAPFESDSDDFKGIIENNEPLTITDVMQKTVYKMNEKGTEATAATGVILTSRSLPQPSTLKTFNANCPFLFLLEYSDTIILSGTFVTG